MEPKVGIVLVNYNTYSDTVDCIKSLKSINYSNFIIVIVDNCSTDDSFNKLVNIKDEKIIFVKNSVNGGWSNGNNIGIEKCISLQCDYVLLLNNDTLVEQNFLNKLIECYEENPISGIVAPKIMYNDNRNLIWFAGGSIDFNKYIASNIGNKELDSDIYNSFSETDYITGCAMLISKDVLSKCGLLPEDYFMYMEDVDYSLRIKENGYKLYVCPESVIFHKVSASTGGEDSAFTIKWMTRNRWLFFKKYMKYCKKNKVISFIRILLSNIKNIVNYLVKLDFKRLRAMINGSYEGIKLLLK